MSQTQIDIADTRYKQVLNMPGISIQKYRGQAPAVPFFSNATTYPEFFNENLVSPYRLIKEFIHDPHGNIRALYFQLLRLSFEVDPNNSDYRVFITNLRRMVFAPDFQIMFTPQTESERQIYSDFQFKKFFAEFLVIMQNSTNILVEQIINQYPIIDTVFIHILRSLLAAIGVNEPFEVKIQTQTVFGEFAAPLGLNITSYGNCWKFEDSDMFCFQEDQQKLYIAYIVEGGQVQNHIQSIGAKAGIIPSDQPIVTTVTVTETSPIGTTITQTTTTTLTQDLGSYIPITTTDYTSYSVDPLVSSYTPIVSSYSSDLGQYKSYETTSYTPATNAYEITNTYTSPTTTYQTTNYSSPTTTYTSETYVSSSAPYTTSGTSYEYKPVQLTSYGNSGIDDLVNKYLSGNIDKDYTSPSSYTNVDYSSTYVPTVSTTTVTQIKGTGSGSVDYAAYSPATTTPIDYGAYTTTSSYSSTYQPSSYGITPVTTTNYGITGDYTTGATSSYNYEPSSYTTTTTTTNYGLPQTNTSSYSLSNHGLTNYTTGAVGPGLSSNYQQYGSFKNDFSNNDILNIMNRGNTATSTGAVTTSYSTGPVTTTTPTGASTYEYSTSYTTDPSGAGYSQSTSYTSYSSSTPGLKY